jgi:vacuolar protein sorting-associated protein 13A/C
MFSYDTEDRKNRALVKVGQSGYSPPQSFEAVGQASEVVIPKEWETDPGDAHLGITVQHGLEQVKKKLRPLMAVQINQNCYDTAQVHSRKLP